MENDELLTIATEIALAGAELAKRRRAEGAHLAASKTSLTDIVTHADREVEALARSIIEKRRPSDGFLGEESGSGGGSSGLTWVVDPIDGTVNYYYGIPHYAVSIAVVEGDPDPATWNTLAGAVASPGNGELFQATAGGGATLDGHAIQVAEPVELSQALVGTGFSYLSDTRSEQAAIIAGLLPRVRDIRRMGTASLDICNVACGRFNAYFERNLNPWDHAAGALIARESGAVVGGLRGVKESHAFILTAEPVLAAELEGVLLSLGA